VVKVFSREEPGFCRNESQFLCLLRGRLPVRTPELVATGEHRGYPYIIMEEMRGTPLKALWSRLSDRNRAKAVTLAAEMLSCLHSIPAAEVTYRETRGESFMAFQKANLADNHRGFGLDEARIAEAADYIRYSPAVEDTSPQVICHTEIMREHLFADLSSGILALSGLVDFEPSMVAVPEYDLCSVGLFLTAGEKGLFRLFMDAYGYRGGGEGIMRMLLLHRYSNMKWFISTLPVELRTAPLDEMRSYWFV
jgi:hygromycin-B 7''-O-kinase